MAGPNKSSKKPASEKRKSARAASRNRGEERKAERRTAQAERAKINREHRARGEATPAEAAYLERRDRRRALAHIASRGCPTVTCGRTRDHKGKHGEPTKTEMASALSAVAAIAASPSGGTNRTPKRATWERATRALKRRHTFGK